MSRTLLLVCLLMAVLLPYRAAPPVAHADGGREVFAYYYSWWNRLSWDPSRMSDHPADLYDSKSEAVIRRQITDAKNARIDGFICTWVVSGWRLV